MVRTVSAAPSLWGRYCTSVVLGGEVAVATPTMVKPAARSAGSTAVPVTDRLPGGSVVVVVVAWEAVVVVVGEVPGAGTSISMPMAARPVGRVVVGVPVVPPPPAGTDAGSRATTTIT